MSKRPPKEFLYVDSPAEPVIQLLAAWVNDPPRTVIVFRPVAQSDGSWLIRVIPAGVALNREQLDAKAARVVIPASAALTAGEALKRVIVLRAVLERALCEKLIPGAVPDTGGLPSHTPWYSYGGDGNGNGAALLPKPVEGSKAFAAAWGKAAAEYLAQKAGVGFVNVTLC